MKTKAITWKPVALEGNLLKDNTDGLLAIEECVDYDLNSIISSKKTRKRKRNNENEKVFELLPQTKKKKIKSSGNDTCKSLNRQIVKCSATNNNKAICIEDIQFSPSTKGSTNQDTTEVKEPTCDSSNDPDDFGAWNSYGLSELLLKAIMDLGFIQPTTIQALTLPPAVLGQRDILGAAETGSGKTLAFGLPILNGILNLINRKSSPITQKTQNTKKQHIEEFDQETGCVKVIEDVCMEKFDNVKPLYALILTPTRELAIQIKNHLTAAAKYTGIKIAVVLGGMAVVKQERVLSKGPEIVVATPGRLWELIREGNSHLSQVDNIRFLAIDETDRMLERGHFKELHDLLERLNAEENKHKQRQNFVFSATLTLIHDLPKHLAMKKKMKTRNTRKIVKMTVPQKLGKIIELLGITNPKIVDVTQQSGTAATLTECRITCDFAEKDYYVYYFLRQHPGRTLIFCNSIGCVKRLTTLLGLLGCKPMALHASMQQRQRLKNLDRFRDDQYGILIATDVAARGLDIPCVEHVLHYQTPRTSEGYVHRSGRTARASRQGITVLLVEPTELSNYLRLCRTLGRTQDLPLFPVQEKVLNCVKERVKLARELDKLELQIKKTNSECGWIQKAAEEMDIIIDDVYMKYDTKVSSTAKKVADIKRKQLTALLAKPLTPKGFSGKYPLMSKEPGLLYSPLEQKNEMAVDVLRNSVENCSKSIRKKAKWFSQPKSKTLEQKPNSLQKDNNKSKKGKKKHFF